MCRAYNWHSKCKDTMKIRHRKCREGNTISSPWFECRTGTRIMPVYIQLKETILCCLPCISCDVFSSCLCIDCANCERDVYLDTPYSTMCNKYGTGITQTSRRTPAKHTMMAHLDLFLGLYSYMKFSFDMGGCYRSYRLWRRRVSRHHQGLFNTLWSICSCIQKK